VIGGGASCWLVLALGKHSPDFVTNDPLMLVFLDNALNGEFTDGRWRGWERAAHHTE
jgi:hypothetical protein